MDSRKAGLKKGPERRSIPFGIVGCNRISLNSVSGEPVSVSCFSIQEETLFRFDRVGFFPMSPRW